MAFVTLDNRSESKSQMPCGVPAETQAEQHENKVKIS